MMRRDKSPKLDKVIRALKADPELTNTQLRERFKVGQGTVRKAREATGIEQPEPLGMMREATCPERFPREFVSFVEWKGKKKC